MLLLSKMAFVRRIRQFHCQFQLNSRFSQMQCLYALVPCRNLSNQVNVMFYWERCFSKRFSWHVEPKQEEILAANEQDDQLTSVKSQNAEAQLQDGKKIAEDEEVELKSGTNNFDREKMNELIRGKFYYDQSFAIYDRITGQFDFGPMGCALKNNILSVWKSFFVLEEQMLEIECPILTPKSVLMSSGHVNKFTDLIVKDVKTGDYFRLDPLIKISLTKKMTDKKTPQNVKEECEKICVRLDGMSKAQKSNILRKYNIRSPITGNNLTDPIDYCLMLETQVGPSGVVKGFLRPETAQGIFVNFQKLLDINNGKFPFAVAQVGKVFRNGTPPREFILAEIEHFCDPDDKSHPKFQDVADTLMCFYSASNQVDGKSPEEMTIGEAVRSGIVSSETLGYFMAKVQSFLLKIGLKSHGVRFRQQMSKEMSHNTCDCWDAECLTSYGWIECVGCADRSVYDLTQHSKATGTKLVAERRLPRPKTVTVKEIVPNKTLISESFEGNSNAVRHALKILSDEGVSDVEKQLELKGSCDMIINFKVYNLTKEMIYVKTYEKVLEAEEFTPGVIESSFGIGRIMYALFEQSFRLRENEEHRSYFALPPLVAPIKCCLMCPGSMRARPDFSALFRQLSTELTKLEVSHKIDGSYFSIGVKCLKTDKIAIPFIVVIDFDTFQVPHTATVRDRDSMNQVRVPLDEIPGVISDLCRGKISWSQVEEKYPKFEQQESSKSQDTMGENASIFRKSGRKFSMVSSRSPSSGKRGVSVKCL